MNQMINVNGNYGQILRLFPVDSKELKRQKKIKLTKTQNNISWSRDQT